MEKIEPNKQRDDELNELNQLVQHLGNHIDRLITQRDKVFSVLNRLTDGKLTEVEAIKEIKWLLRY